MAPVQAIECTHAMKVTPSGDTPEARHMKGDPWNCTQSTVGVGSVKAERSVSNFSWLFSITVMPHLPH